MSVRVLIEDGPGAPPDPATFDPAWRRAVEASTGVLQMDALARRAALLLQSIAVPVSRAAAPFVAHAGWKAWARARQEDFAREVLFRSGRWLRRAAALGRAIEKWPQLAAALDGSDGQPALGQVAALEVASIADDGSLATWIALARRTTLRELRDAIAAARETGEVPATVSCTDIDEVRLRILAAPAHLDLFEAGLERHRQCEGYEATITSFIEALHGEVAAGPIGPATEEELRAVDSGPSRADDERRVAGGHRRTEVPEVGPDVAEVLAAIAARIAMADALFSRAGKGGGRDLGQQLVDLLRLESELRRVIGSMLALLGRCRAWSKLGYLDAAHYAEDRLGMARSTAMELHSVARVSTLVPEFAEFYEPARIHTSNGVLVSRLLRRACGGHWESVGPLAARWAIHAGDVTVKRMRDELQIVTSRVRRGEYRDKEPLPLSDEEWRMERTRFARTDAGEVAAAVQRGLEQELTATLDLRLERDLALHFTAALDRVGAQLLAASQEPSADSPEHRKLSAAALLRVRGAALACTVSAYMAQNHASDPLKAGDRRCDAPGCTARACHAHHVRYRSRGGSSGPENLVMLCPFHHLQGEHGLLMRVRGAVPHGLVYRLGPPDHAEWYQNERRVLAA